MVDFLGIGVQKGGTAWLYENMVVHPDVWLPFIKEVHFFDKLYLERGKLEDSDFQDLHFVTVVRRRIKKLMKGKIESLFGQEAEIVYLQRLIDPALFMTEEWYDFLFSPAPPECKKGEITPLYCAMGKEGLLYLKKRFPAVRLIYLIRDPVDRALSCMRMLAERRDVDMQDPTEVERLTKKCLRSPIFFMRGDFRSHIPLWDRHFGDQVLYVPFGEIRLDPEGLFRRIESFIGVRAFADYPSLRKKVHSTIETAEIPHEVRARFADINTPQYEFLRRRFSRDFVENLS